MIGTTHVSFGHDNSRVSKENPNAVTHIRRWWNHNKSITTGTQLPTSLSSLITPPHLISYLSNNALHPLWQLKLSDWELTPPTDQPLSMWLKQSIVNNIRRDMQEEVEQQGIMVAVMCCHLLHTPFTTLTWREKCLQDRWLGMEKSLPLLMTMGQSPSPSVKNSS